MAKTSAVFKKFFFHVRFEICYFHGLDSAFQKVLHWTKSKTREFLGLSFVSI